MAEQEKFNQLETVFTAYSNLSLKVIYQPFYLFSCLSCNIGGVKRLHRSVIGNAKILLSGWHYDSN